MDDVTSTMVEFPGGGKGRNAAGFLVRPRGAGKSPGVVVIQEVWGLVDHIKDIANRLAREGYAALAPDLFDGKTTTSLEEGRRIRDSHTEEKLLGDLRGAVHFLRNQDFVRGDRIGAVGYCMGGWLSLLLACRETLTACVVYYGRNPTPVDQVQNVICPILGHYGGADPGITEQDISILKETLTKHGKSFDIKVYPGAPHAFFNDTKPSYRPEAAKDSWQRTLLYFSKYLK